MTASMYNKKDIETKLEREGLVFFDAEEAPFSIHGITKCDGSFIRMPDSIAATVNDGVRSNNKLTAGGRVRFVTDSPFIAIHTEMSGVSRMPHMAITGSAGFDLYAGGYFNNNFQPPYDIKDGYEKIYDARFPGEQVYTLFFPLYSGVNKLYIGIKDGSSLKPAPDYRIKKPFVTYGSSITQGGCASRPGNAYQSIISRELDCEFLNLGFNGSARGEDAIAEYIAGLEMSAFIYDYDYNAPSVGHLESTHERMFKIIREAQPELPVIILSSPRVYLNDNGKARLEVIRRTYENALAAGDKNVYFIPGPELFWECFKETAHVDNAHPNDSGFMSMALVLTDLLRGIFDAK